MDVNNFTLEELEELDSFDEISNLDDITSTEFEANVEDNYSLFLHDIRNFPILTKEQTEQLFINYKNGDDEARQMLINCNLRLVIKIAKNYENKGLDRLDLVNEGVIGLNRAIQLFDLSKGFRFSTYATEWIHQSIGRAVLDLGKTIRLPVHIYSESAAIMRAKQEFVDSNGYEPTDEQLSKILGGKYTADKIAEIREAFTNTNIDSLDRDVFEGVQLGEVVSSAQDDKAILMKEEQDSIIHKMLDSLDARSQTILIKAFGLFGTEPQTLQEIGNSLGGISRERVRQIKETALFKLSKNYSQFKCLVSAA